MKKVQLKTLLILAFWGEISPSFPAKIVLNAGVAQNYFDLDALKNAEGSEFAETHIWFQDGKIVLPLTAKKENINKKEFGTLNTAKSYCKISVNFVKGTADEKNPKKEIKILGDYSEGEQKESLVSKVIIKGSGEKIKKTIQYFPVAKHIKNYHTSSIRESRISPPAKDQGSVSSVNSIECEYVGAKNAREPSFEDLFNSQVRPLDQAGKEHLSPIPNNELYFHDI